MSKENNETIQGGLQNSLPIIPTMGGNTTSGIDFNKPVITQRASSDINKSEPEKIASGGLPDFTQNLFKGGQFSIKKV
jgi:hypothetical protein